MSGPIVPLVEVEMMVDDYLEAIDNPPIDVTVAWENPLKEGDIMEWGDKNYRITDLERRAPHWTKFTLVRVP